MKVPHFKLDPHFYLLLEHHRAPWVWRVEADGYVGCGPDPLTAWNNWRQIHQDPRSIAARAARGEGA